MAARGDERARRERIRQNIRAFYEVEEKAPAAAADDDDADHQREPAAAKSANKGGDMDIDSQSFNAMRYTTQLLKHQSLQRLVETDNGLRRQVKTLDGDLQSLVYGNYSKFLAAADTIAQVRSNVADMDNRLEALAENVSSMDAVSHTLTADLEAHRTNIEGVLQVNTVLKKVQFLVRLPDVLRRAVATNRLHEAARYWVAGDAVLAKYAHIAAFQRTREAAQREAETVYVRLCERVTAALVPGKKKAGTGAAASPESSPVTAAETDPSKRAAAAAAAAATTPALTVDDLSKDVEMLRLLGRSSVSLERLRDAGAIVASSRDGDIARIFYDHVAGKALERFDAATADACADLNEESKRRVGEVAAIVKHTATGGRSASEVAAELVVALEKCHVRDVVNALHDATVALRASLEEVVAVVGRDQLPTVDVGAVAMAAAQPALEACVETYASTTAASISECATVIARGFALRCEAVETTPEGAEATRNAAFALHMHLTTSAKTFSSGLRMVARECLRTAHINNTDAFADFAAVELTGMLGRIAVSLQDLSDGFKAEAALAPTSSASASSSSSAKPPLVIAAFVFCAAALAHTMSSLSVDALATNSSDRVVPAADEARVRQKFDDARRRLVLSGIHAAGDACHGGSSGALDELSALSSSDAPKGVSAFGQGFATSSRRVACIVDAFVWADGGNKHHKASRHGRTGSTVGSTLSRGSGDSGAQAGGNRSSAGVSRSAAGRSSGASGTGGGADGQHSKARAAQHLRRDSQSVFTSDVDRLFSRPAGQSVTLRPSQIDGPHVMECILSHALVSIVDDVRRLRFDSGPAAFQQLQIDAAFVLGLVGANAKSWTRKLDRVTNLVDELAASAYDRCGKSRAALPPDAVLGVVHAEERRLAQQDQA